MNKKNLSITGLEAFAKAIPPVFARKEVAKLTGGLISARYLANLDSQGLGPKGRMRLGKLVGYERESFLSWVEARLTGLDD